MKFKTALSCLLLALCLLCGCGATEDAPVEDKTPEPTVSPYLVDKDVCSYELLSFELDESGNYIWRVELTNRSEQPLTFGMDEVYLNDYRADPYWASVVAAGASAEQEIVWSAEELSRNGIAAVSRVDFRLTAATPTDSGDVKLDERITAYPQGKAAYRNEQYIPAENEQKVVENETARVYLLSGLQDELLLRFYFRNNSKMVCYLAVTELKVNGQAVDSGLRLRLDSEKQGFMKAAWTAEQLTALEIDTISGVTMQLAVCDAATDAVLWSDSLTLTP